MGIPIYPKDQGTEWMNLKTQVKNAFTSANSRVPYQKITAGILRVSSELQILAGSAIEFIYNNGILGMLMGEHVSGPDDVEGIFIKRNNGTIAFWIFSRISDGYGFTALYDQQENIIFSDDGNSGKGIARPWIPMTFVNTTELPLPPAARQTSSTSDTAVVTLYPNAQHSYIRYIGYVYTQNAGVTVQVKFKNAGSGVTYESQTVEDGFIFGTFALTGYSFGEEIQMDVTIRRASGSGNVGFTLISCYGRQSP